MSPDETRPGTCFRCETTKQVSLLNDGREICDLCLGPWSREQIPKPKTRPWQEMYPEHKAWLEKRKRQEAKRNA